MLSPWVLKIAFARVLWKLYFVLQNGCCLPSNASYVVFCHICGDATDNVVELPNHQISIFCCSASVQMGMDQLYTVIVIRYLFDFVIADYSNPKETKFHDYHLKIVTVYRLPGCSQFSVRNIQPSWTVKSSGTSFPSVSVAVMSSFQQLRLYSQFTGNFSMLLLLMSNSSTYGFPRMCPRFICLSGHNSGVLVVLQL